MYCFTYYNTPVYCFTYYTIGKDSSLDTSCSSVIDATVFRLLQGLENKGHHVYTDNYYSNPTLYTKLKELGYEACGTVKVNRKGMPKEWMKDKKIDKGEVRSKNLGNNLIALQWMDKRLVTMISTVHNDDMVSKRRRTKHATGGQEEIEKPKMVEEYNSYMGGVDKSDQLLSYYGFAHRSVKWWKRVAFHLLDLSIVNAYIMYRQSKQERYLTHEQFRINLSKDLLLKAGIYFNDIPTQRTSAPPASRLTERHFPSKIPEQGKQHQLDCSVCSDRKKGKRKMTIYMCQKCGVALCVAPCFELHHTRVNPKRYL